MGRLLILRRAIILAVVPLLAVSASPSSAQKSISEVFGREATPEGKPRTLLEELMLYSYIENSYVENLGHEGRHHANELRFYDFDAGYTFNAFELSFKKDPSERRPWGFGVVGTAGRDSQKNHALGIFRSLDDNPPLYKNTPYYDLPEMYGSVLLPVGSGLTLKAGKWATLTGFEVYESPKNLNFSKSFLYSLGTPYTHTGLLGTYQFTPWFGMTAGFSNGWDNSDNNNGFLRPTGQFVFTPIEKLSVNLNWLAGKEQNRDVGAHTRWLIDWVVTYTGIDKVTLGLNLDIAGEHKEPTLVAAGTRRDTDVNWGGWALYGAYDWTPKLRTALRAEYFADPQGVRNNNILTPGTHLALWEGTATVEYKIWKGLVGRLEYRHDSANRKVFSVSPTTFRPTSPTQDTLTLAAYYAFF